METINENKMYHKAKEKSEYKNNDGDNDDDDNTNEYYAVPMISYEDSDDDMDEDISVDEEEWPDGNCKISKSLKEDFRRKSDVCDRLEMMKIQENNLENDILNLNEDLCRKLSEEDKLIMEHTEFKDSHIQKQNVYNEKLDKLKLSLMEEYNKGRKREQKKKLAKFKEETSKIEKGWNRLRELNEMKDRKYGRARKDIESEKNEIKKQIHKMERIQYLKLKEIVNLCKLQYNKYDEDSETEQLVEMKLEILPLNKATVKVHDEQNAENKLQTEDMNIVELLVKASTLEEVHFMQIEHINVENDKEQMLNPCYHEDNRIQETIEIDAPMVHKHEGNEIMEYLGEVKKIRNKYITVCNKMLIFEGELDDIEGELRDMNAIIMVHKAKEASYRWEPGLDPGIEEIQKLNEIVKGQSRENFKEVNIQVDNVERNEANKIEEFENIKTENLKLEEIKEIENIITWGNEKNSYGGHTCYQWEPGINNEENTMIDYMEGYKNYRNQKNFLQNEYPPKIDNSSNKCKTNHEIDKSGANMVGCPFHRVKMKNNKRGRTHKNGKMKDETQLLQLLQQLYNKD